MGTNGKLDDLACLRADTTAFLEAARAGPLSAEVAGCPGWDLATLCGHMGRVHRWATLIVSTGQPPERGAVPDPPDDPALVVDYLAGGFDPLLDTLANADPDTPCWNRWGVNEVAGFWRRRQAVETAVHRWDAQAAVGSPRPVDTALAVAGVDEIVDVWLPTTMARREGGVPFARSLHLHATDYDGEWTITGDADGDVTVERGHAKGDAAVRGPASALLLLLWRRIPPDHPDLTLFGDRAVVGAWLAAGVP